MPQNQLTKYPLRSALLAKKFVEDYDAVIKDCSLPLQVEITEYLLTVLDIIEEYAKSEDQTVYKRFVTLSEDLLKKHRRVLEPVWNKQFHVYFRFDNVLADKKVIPNETFNRLTAAEQRISGEEITDFVKMCRNVLSNGRHFMLLRMEPEYSLSTESSPVSNDTATFGDQPDDGITKARQMLALYYLLKAAFNIEHRSSHTISEVVRFIHLLTGKKFTTLQNSDIYKKYQQMPNYNGDERLVKDLQFIRPYFEGLHLKSALDLIDAEIDRCIKELPDIIKKKYR